MIEAMDRKLVRALNANARKSYREIAKELGTSTTAVIRGIKKLEASGAISGYIPVVDPAAFGFDLTVVISLRINQGQLLETQRQIARDPHVALVLDVTGEWDSLVVAHFQGREDLNTFLKKINGMKHVVPDGHPHRPEHRSRTTGAWPLNRRSSMRVASQFREQRSGVPSPPAAPPRRFRTVRGDGTPEPHWASGIREI